MIPSVWYSIRKHAYSMHLPHYGWHWYVMAYTSDTPRVTWTLGGHIPGRVASLQPAQP